MRCKRCGSVLNYDDIMCKGCGRSLVDLKAQNEIEFDENATINVEPIKHTEVSKVVEEEKPTDVFGDAIYNQQNELEAEVLKPNETIIEPLQVESSVEDKTEEMNIEPLQVVDLSSKEESIVESIETEESNEKDENIVEPVTQPTLSHNEPVQKVDIESNNIDITQITKDNIDSEIEEDFIPKKKSKKSLIIAIIALIVLGLAGVVTYFYIKTNPKSIFKTGINKLFSYGNIEKLSGNNIKSETYFRFNVTDTKQDEMLELLNNITIDMKSHIDKANKNIMISLDSKYENSELLKVNIYATNSQIYGLLENVYDKYIGFPLDSKIFNKLFEENNYFDEMSIITKELSKEINNTLDKKYLKRTVSGLETISTLELDKDSYKNFVTSLLTKIKNNNNLIDSMAIITEKSSINLKQDIDNKINNFNGELQKIKIILTTNILDGCIKKIEAYLNDNTDKITMTVDINNKNNYNFTIKVNEEIIKGTLNITDNAGFTEYSFTFENEEYGKINYIFGYKLTENDTLIIPELTNIINYEEMPEEELETILTNLFQKEGILNLYEIFSTTDENELKVDASSIAYKALNSVQQYYTNSLITDNPKTLPLTISFANLPIDFTTTEPKMPSSGTITLNEDGTYIVDQLMIDSYNCIYENQNFVCQ